MKSKHGFETTPERSEIMRAIKGKNTRPEILLRKALWAAGLRYRLNVKHLPGKPDIVLARHKVAVFVDGEFWHGYKWAEKKLRLVSNRGYWIRKIEGNIARDKKSRRELRTLGFTVVRFWQHEIMKDLDACVLRINRLILRSQTDDRKSD